MAHCVIMDGRGEYVPASLSKHGPWLPDDDKGAGYFNASFSGMGFLAISQEGYQMVLQSFGLVISASSLLGYEGVI